MNKYSYSMTHPLSKDFVNIRIQDFVSIGKFKLSHEKQPIVLSLETST